MPDMTLEPDWGALVPEVVLRPAQLDILHRSWEAMKDHDVIFMEAPPGVGKSAVLLALCRWYAQHGERAHLVTPQRALQDQLGSWQEVDDLNGSGPKVMKGRGCYTCTMIDDTASNAPCLEEPSYREQNTECQVGRCPYYTALNQAQEAAITIHNYASLLAQTYLGNAFGPRDLLALDEGHTAADWIRNYMTVEITEEDAQALWPGQPVPQLPNELLAWIQARVATIQDQSDLPDHLRMVLRRMKQHNALYQVLDADALDAAVREHHEALILQETDERVFWRWLMVRPGLAPLVPWAVLRKDGRITLVPLKTSPCAQLLAQLGRKIVLTSATILDAQLLQLELGLKGKSVAFIRSSAAFDPQRRPIRLSYVGRMSYDKRDLTFPRLVERVVLLARTHADERGIIHTVSHHLAKQLTQALQAALKHRRVIALPRGQERDQVICDFLDGKRGDNAILIGPSLMEGIDGIGDRCRWQVLAKAPYPSQADPVVRYILDHQGAWGALWYTWKTAQATIQGLGRNCRGPDDFGVSYVLDSCFREVLGSKLVPSYVRQAVVDD